MAGMDGFQVLREIRRTSKVPVLLLTARAEAEDKIEGFESGADDYLAKPFLPRELLLRVKAILNRAYPRQERKVYLQDGMVDLDKAIPVSGLCFWMNRDRLSGKKDCQKSCQNNILCIR